VLQRRGLRPRRKQRALAAVACPTSARSSSCRRWRSVAQRAPHWPAVERGRRCRPGRRSAGGARHRHRGRHLQAGHGGVTSETLFRGALRRITARDPWKPPVRASGRSLDAKQLAGAALAVATPLATVQQAASSQAGSSWKLAGRAVLHARHFGALPNWWARTDLLAIVPRMFRRVAGAAGTRCASGSCPTWRRPTPCACCGMRRPAEMRRTPGCGR